MELNTNKITDMGQLSSLAYMEYETSIRIGDEYSGNITLVDYF